MRSGVIAQKVGMTRIYNDAGDHVPVTVLKMENCQVVAQRTEEKNGYTAVQLGVGLAKVKNTSKPMRGHFAAASIEPKARLAEFRVSPDNMLEVGDEIIAGHYLPGQFIDVTGTSVGKGFQGVMKRHNFGGGRATHGNSISHRAHGSTGQRQDPGKVFKGKKMAGHMGHVTVTTQNLRIVETDNDRGLLLVSGAVPGPKGGWVLVKDAVKKPLPEGVLFPAATRKLEKQADAAAAEAEEALAAEAEAAAAEQAEAEREALKSAEAEIAAEKQEGKE